MIRTPETFPVFICGSKHYLPNESQTIYAQRTLEMEPLEGYLTHTEDSFNLE